jgi:chromate transporter
LRKPTLGSIFRAFLRLGLTAFGGPAMVAHIGELAVERKGWLSRDAFKDGVALAQSIPGATAMQTAAYCGLQAGGKWGAAAAYVGFGLPAMVMMIGLSAAYAATHRSPISTALFCGLQVVVVAIVSRAVITFGKTAIRSVPAAAIAVGAGTYLMYGGSPFIVIVCAAAFGIALCRPSGEADGQTDEPEEDGSLKWLGVMIALVAVGLAALWFTDSKLFDLSALMMRIDAAAFGGGFASVPLMLNQVVGVRHWMDAGTFMDGIAMGQVTPGPIVITATFVGYQLAGLAGAFVGTAAVFLPSFVILVTIEPYFKRLRKNAVFQRAIAGILASFVGLILSTAIKFGLAAHWSAPTILLCCGAFAALMLKVDILPVVVVGGIISVLVLR